MQTRPSLDYRSLNFSSKGWGRYQDGISRSKSGGEVPVAHGISRGKSGAGEVPATRGTSRDLGYTPHGAARSEHFLNVLNPVGI